MITTQIIIVLLSFVSLCIIEILYNYYVIDVQNYSSPNYQRDSNGWHLWDAAQYALMCGIAVHLLHKLKLDIVPSIEVFVTLFLIRLTVFQNGLNLIRKQGFWHIGTTGLDGFWTKIFGTKAPYVIFLSLIHI